MAPTEKIEIRRAVRRAHRSHDDRWRDKISQRDTQLRDKKCPRLRPAPGPPSHSAADSDAPAAYQHCNWLTGGRSSLGREYWPTDQRGSGHGRAERAYGDVSYTIAVTGVGIGSVVSPRTTRSMCNATCTNTRFDCGTRRSALRSLDTPTVAIVVV
jgi:hypothetical protein